MDRGSYAAASGGLAQLRLLDIVTNNLANVNTAGYKQDFLITRQQNFDDTLASRQATDEFAKGDHARTPGAVQTQERIDLSVGSFRQTGGAMDVALRNQNDFFVILTPDGTQLTRAGSFTLDGAGNVVTQSGLPVSGGGGPITVNANAPTTISPGGAVMSGGAIVGQLQVQRVSDPEALEKVGHARFKIKEGAGAAVDVLPDLESGTLENANISMTSAMVQMIAAHRGFAAYTKIAGAIDEMNKDAVTQIISQR